MSSEPLPDLDSPQEISTFVRRFYGDVAQDDVIGPMFNDIAQVDWADHIPRLIAFWSRELLGIEGYAGNPFSKHLGVHKQSPFTDAHFARWLRLFNDTLDGGWDGPNVQRAKDLAARVAEVHRDQLFNNPRFALVP